MEPTFMQSELGANIIINEQTIQIDNNYPIVPSRQRYDKFYDAEGIKHL
jgi:hypothetical protein